MDDFFCKILLGLVQIKKINCTFFENYLYFKDFFPPRKSHWLLTHWHSSQTNFCSVSASISEKEDEWKLRKQQT